MPSNNYKFEESDIRLLKEARHNIDRVLNYNDGAANSRQVVNRLRTLKYKIDDLLEIGGDQ